MSALKENVRKVLVMAGFAEYEEPTAGFQLTGQAEEVDVYLLVGEEEFEATYSDTARDPGHPAYSMRLFRLRCENALIAAYAAVLHAAGFTVTLLPDEADDHDGKLRVTDGPLVGIRPKRYDS
ncbi:hypothetical protein [Actinocorallia aurantiaca]|uniref:Tail terminator n=1 Tax=Actinocorallia aurantiaca TaxID=46204 RepID=A0ABN3UJ28_9ACTN